MTHDTPYLHLVGMPREMAGKGAPKPTIYGVIGRTTLDPFTRTLGGLVKHTMEGKLNPGTAMSARKAPETEHCIIGAPGKTRFPSAHYGQVPYVGKFIDKVGKKL
jgi:hypothetical protein